MDEEEEIQNTEGTQAAPAGAQAAPTESDNTGPTLENMKGPLADFVNAANKLLGSQSDNNTRRGKVNTAARDGNNVNLNMLGENTDTVNTVPETTTVAAPDTSVTADIQESTNQAPNLMNQNQGSSPFDILRNQRELSRAVRAGEQPTVDPSSVLSPVSARTADGQTREGGLIGFTPQFEGQTLGQFIRGEDTQQQATFTGVDAQGRLRQFTPEGQLADSYSGFEAESQAREARIGQAPGVGGAGSAFRDRDLDPSGRFKPSGSAVGTGISISDARNLVDPEGKMSSQARTAAAREYIRQQGLKASETQRGIEEQERAEARQAQKDVLEERNIESLIASREADEPEMSLRELIDETDDLDKKIKNNTATPNEINRYNTNAILLGQKNIFDYPTVDADGKQGGSGGIVTITGDEAGKAAYDQLKSGDKYTFNGVEYSKQ
jgi:hypothetical protein